MGTIAWEVLRLVATLVVSMSLLALVARQRPQWQAALAASRFGCGLSACSAIVLVKLVEDVSGGETSAFDLSVLVWLHDTVSLRWSGVFEAITVTGSFTFVAVTGTLSAAFLWHRGRRASAANLALTPVAAGALIYAAKALVDRPRPTLWPTDYYWGSSFPSGHTLAVAAMATSAYLVARSAGRTPAAAVGIAGALWVLSVGLSRLVLGVHWPSDVVAAACAGLLVSAACHASVHRLTASRTKGPLPAPTRRHGVSPGGEA